MNNSRAGHSRRQFLKIAAGTGALSALSSAGLPTLIEQLDQPFKVPSASALTVEGDALPPLFVIVYNRMGFGLRPGFEDEAAFNALGADDDARLAAYVEQQLDPDSINDSACDSRIASAGFITTSKTLHVRVGRRLLDFPSIFDQLPDLLADIINLLLCRLSKSSPRKQGKDQGQCCYGFLHVIYLAWPSFRD